MFVEQKVNHNLYRKIAIRFLKESGLYNAFKDYLKSRSKNEKENWYRKELIDQIFSESYFTAFIERTRGFHPDYKITPIFRTYVKKKYGHKFEFIRPLFLPDNVHPLKQTKIDSENDLITIRQIKYESVF